MGNTIILFIGFFQEKDINHKNKTTWNSFYSIWLAIFSISV
jgi:hypothetical protein